MGKEKFIWCRNCDAVHHVTDLDKAPAYTFLAGELEENPMDDWRAFMKQHEGHWLEPLKQLTEKVFLNGSTHDPMSDAYIEVTNGQEHLLLRQARRNIYEPLIFERIAGRLVDNGMTLKIQENEIKKEMKYHFDWSAEPLGDDRIHLFVELFRNVVNKIKPEQVDVTSSSFDEENVFYGALEARVLDTLMVKCAAHFLPGELLDIRRFIDSHREVDDVMALVVHRHIELERPAA